MALVTLGTTTQTSFNAIKFVFGMNPADLASLNAMIFRDNNPAYNTSPEVEATSIDTAGFLTLPGGRGKIQLKPGDYIAVDPTTGWPIVVSANCAANGAIIHT
jgi:hypothetical protein